MIDNGSFAGLFWLNELLECHSEHIERLTKRYFHDLRGEGPTRKLHEVTRNRIPVFSAFQGKTSCCLNYKIMKSAHDKIGEPFTAQDEAGLSTLVDIALSENVRLDMSLQRGDIQLVKNYVLFHRRRRSSSACPAPGSRQSAAQEQESGAPRPSPDSRSIAKETG